MLHRRRRLLVVVDVADANVDVASNLLMLVLL